MRRRLVPFAVLAALVAFAGSAAAASRLYVPLYYHEPQAVAGFDRQPDGTLTPLTGSPFGIATEPPGGIGGMAFAPDGRRAVASFFFEGGVLGLSVGPDGSISPAQSPILGARVHGIAVTPDGRFVYAGNVDLLGEEGILGYSFGPDGTVAPLSGGHFGEGKYWDLAVTPDGRFLFATPYPANRIDRFAINADGSLSSLGSTTVSTPSTLVTSPNGRYLFVSVGNGSEAGVASFTIGADGGLTQNGEPALNGDNGIDYFAVSPDGGHIYMPADNVDALVTAAVAGDGTLSVIGSMPIENPGSPAVTPDGRFLYAAYAGGPGRIQVASIGPDGKPTLLPFTISWDSGEPERVVFQPPAQATPSLRFKPVAPGTPAHFDAGGSTGATRYDWDFGDGTTLANGGPKPAHSYAKASVYKVRLTVTNEEGGCSTQQIYTGQSTTCPGGASITEPLDTLPKIGPLVLSNTRFAVAGGQGRMGKRDATTSGRRVRKGSTFHYRLSERAKVLFRIDRRTSGRRVGKQCKPATEKNRNHKKCGLFKKAGVFTTSAKAGKNKRKFSGKLKGRKLRPGIYRATATATDPAGGRSAPRRASFQIVGG